MRKNKREEALSSLRRLLGPSREHHKTQIIKEIETSINNQAQSSLSDQVRKVF